MTLTKYLILAVLFLQLVPLANGESARPKLMARLIRSKPTVYLTFAATLKAQSSAQEPEMVLVLHNNTRWQIHYHLLPRSSQGDLLPVLYRIGRETREFASKPGTGDVVFGTTLPSGGSVRFAVARAHLGEGRSVYVEFNYDWERSNGKPLFGSEPSSSCLFP